MIDQGAEFRFRTEDLKPEEIENLFVATDLDREITTLLKSQTPVILEGSRGTGKSFLMRVAEGELDKSFDVEKILPVYISFVKSSLIHTNDPEQFQHWMLAKLCSRIIRVLRGKGLLSPAKSSLSLLSGGYVSLDGSTQSKLERVTEEYEQSYRSPGVSVDSREIPDVQDFKDAAEELCKGSAIARICVLFDEAVHIFRPEQQRQFFTLFRDLRSPYLSCNAAVYPGVTSYGPVFELTHDATLKRLERDVLARNYLDNMRDIALKHAGSSVAAAIDRNGQNFAVLAYSVSGNPRLLLKTLAKCPYLATRDVNEVIKTFYRSTIWSEHSGLAEAYGGHKHLIDWGRNFLENFVLPDTKAKNDRRASEGQNESTCYFWVHRDAPEQVKHALRLLAYTGVVQKGDEGIRGTRSEPGTRYAVNMGCLFSLEAAPVSAGLDIAKNLSIKRFTEFGANHQAFQDLLKDAPKYESGDMLAILTQQMTKSIDELDITPYQNRHLKQIGIDTIGVLLRADERELIDKIYYVGPVRARQIKNAADAAVMEYLSG